MVLGAVLPEMRHEVEALASDLSALVALRKKIDAERDQLKTEMASLDGEQARMTALVEERQKQIGEREKALDAERTRAAKSGPPGRQSQRFDRKARTGPRSGNSRSYVKPPVRIAALHYRHSAIRAAWLRLSLSPPCADKFLFRLTASS